MEIAMRLAMLAVLALIALPSSSWAADVEANKRLFRDWMEEVWNKRQPSAIERYLAPNFIEHNPNIPPGLDGRKQFVAALQAGFSDYRGEIEQIVAEGNMLVVRILWTGTQDGPFLGQPPSGRKLSFRTADFFRIENGKFAEHWDVVDSLTRAVALGLVPAPKPSPQR
ncbi:MAG TPA: ester cyclase [Reyranella sp.]|jgi:predicted ester cyclase|nr:ester cyclase [Reyranella sp.]